MFGMSFPAFLTLLVLWFISSFVMHVFLRYRVLAGLDGFMCKWIAGWAGAWLGSPIFGHWGIQTGSLYLVPAVLGAFAGSFLVTAVFRAQTISMAMTPRREAAASQAGTSSQFEMRKAS